jgi:exopolysaccharide biosynthesis polyprenyl glycosylphosphotransferase
MSVHLRYGGGLDSAGWRVHLASFTVIHFFWLLVFFMHGLFEVSSFRRFSRVFFNLLSAMAANIVVAIIYFYFQRDLILTPRRFLLIHVGISFVLILVWHLVVKYFLKNRLNQDIYIFSFNQELKELEDEITSHNYLGFKVLGHLNEKTLTTQNFKKEVSIVLPDNLQAQPEVLSKFYELRKLGVGFFNHKDFYEDILRKIYLSQINEAWFLENINYKEKRFYKFVKRILDLIFGIVGTVIFLVSFPFVALLIKLTSQGPILFIQERVGQNGKLFKVYKYRSMGGPVTNTWTSVNDPRITKVGRFLRKSRIDEWPQFVNLLLGNMSLVGPRPEQPHIVESLRKQIPFYDERHLVKPGITGWAQLNNIYAGSEEETRLKLQYDLYYIKHRSFLFDAEIILKTIYYIFTWQGR